MAVFKMCINNMIRKYYKINTFGVICLCIPLFIPRVITALSPACDPFCSQIIRLPTGFTQNRPEKNAALTRSTRSSNWKRNSSSTCISPGIVDTRWQDCCNWPRDRWKSGFRTAGWRWRKRIKTGGGTVNWRWIGVRGGVKMGVERRKRGPFSSDILYLLHVLL